MTSSKATVQKNPSNTKNSIPINLFNSLNDFLMNFSNKSSKGQLPFGLDIGKDSVKIVQLTRKNGKETVIEKSILEKIPVEERDIAYGSQSPLVSLLRKIVQDNKLGVSCYVSMPTDLYKIIYLTLAEMPEAELEKAVYWEMKRRAGEEGIDLSTWDYFIINAEKTGYFEKQRGVFVVVGNAKGIKQYLEMFKAAGLKPLALEPDILSSASVLVTTKPLECKGVVAYLDLGAAHSTLNVFCNGELAFTRNLQVNGDKLTKQIATYCNVPWDQAEKMKKEFGLKAALDLGDTVPSDAAIRVKNAILSSFEDMVGDFQHSFKFFCYQVTGSSIASFDHLVLSGGGSLLEGSVDILKDRLQKDVFFIEDLKATSSGSGSNLVLMQTAYGLALRGLEK